MHFRWLLAIHVIFVVCWYAGLFYLPRLFVYHATAEDTTSRNRFKLMERKLFWGIMTPCAIISLITGLWLLYGYVLVTYPGGWWLHIKLICAGLLFVYQGFCYKYLMDFKHERNKHSHKFYRWFNEIPAILLIIIIVMVVVQPF